MATIIIPANNEQAYLGGCLDAILASDPAPQAVHVVVAANACTDDTVPLAQARLAAFQKKGWTLDVLNLPQPGKLNALNEADKHATHGPRIYLDADVIMTPPLLMQLIEKLQQSDPAYASGTLRIKPTGGPIWHAYAKFWASVPFMSQGVPGCGLFAVNDAGRQKWGKFPDIISDDTYVRLLFKPEERYSVQASYDWPIVSGFRRLVKVRRRQDRGVAEIEERFPELLKNDDKLPMGTKGLLVRLARNPLGFVAYCSVAMAVRFMPAPSEAGWARGR